MSSRHIHPGRRGALMEIEKQSKHQRLFSRSQKRARWMPESSFRIIPKSAPQAGSGFNHLGQNLDQ